MDSLNRIKELFNKKKRKKAKILYNVFNTGHKKNALISYIKEVFENEYSKKDLSHTNKLTTVYIAEILEELGYNVDIINWQSIFTDDFSKYDLVLGLGQPLEHILQNRTKGSKPLVIWFGTGCNPVLTNKIALERVVDFYNKKGKILLSSNRYIVEDWPLQHEIADWIIVHGDKFAVSTYRNYNIDSILAPVFIYHSVTRSDKEWLTSKLNFLWFASTGVVHKGLDVLIDTFKKLPQYNLHICGSHANDQEFFNLYKEEIVTSDNIIYHGFVNVQSHLFKDILHSCAFTIFPSGFEGNSPSVITCMANGGLIPIVTKNADVEITNYGIEILGFSEEHIYDAVEKSQNLTLDELKEQSAIIIHQTSNYHTFDAFRKDFKNKLANIPNIIFE